MSAWEERDVGPLAAEYALGTLDAEERAEVAARRLREPELDEAIEEWERRFAPMLDEVQEATPSAGLFRAIESRIAGEAPAAATPILRADDDPRRGGAAAPKAASGASPKAPSGAPSAAPASADVRRLKRSIAAWRGMAVAASVALAALIGTLAYKPELIVPQQDTRYVAVFQDDDKAPRFLMSVDLATRQVTIRPVAAEEQPGKAYELWIVAEALGPDPQSLGLLDGVARPTRKSLASLSPAVLEGALFGISVEPPAGSPTGRPTGPALHGTLIPTATGPAPTAR